MHIHIIYYMVDYRGIATPVYCAAAPPLCMAINALDGAKATAAMERTTK